MMAKPYAAVIIPVWNGRNDLPRCLDSLLAQDYPAFQIIAVDNASTDGSAEFIAANYPSVTLLRQAENSGFACACNVGLRHATDSDNPAAVMVLLNQDTDVQPGWLSALVAMLESDPRIGMAGSKALYPDGTIQHAGATLDLQIGGRHRGAGEQDAGQYDQPCTVDFLSGASLAISRAAYDAIGGLDEGFTPAYFEDVDWCYRVRAAGFQLMYAPDSVLIHHEESVLAGGAHASVYPYQRNRLRLLLKHWPLPRLRDEFAPSEKAWLQRQLSAEFITGVQRAYMYHLLHLDEMVRWRSAFLGEPAEYADDLARMLIDLRTVYSLVAISPPVDGRPANDHTSAAAPHLDELLATARQQANITPRPFRSHAPLISPLIVWFRNAWNQVAAKWFVLPMVEQQNAYNSTLLQALEEANSERDRLARAMVEYTRENSRDLGELTDEVRRLRAELAKMAAQASDSSMKSNPSERDSTVKLAEQ